MTSKSYHERVVSKESKVPRDLVNGRNNSSEETKFKVNAKKSERGDLLSFWGKFLSNIPGSESGNMKRDFLGSNTKEETNSSTQSSASNISPTPIQACHRDIDEISSLKGILDNQVEPEAYSSQVDFSKTVILPKQQSNSTHGRQLRRVTRWGNFSKNNLSESSEITTHPTVVDPCNPEENRVVTSSCAVCNNESTATIYRSRSPALPFKKPKRKSIYASNDVHDPEEEEISIAQAERMYARATWRMYERIMTARAASDLARQQQMNGRYSMPAMNPNVSHTSGIAPVACSTQQLQVQGHLYDPNHVHSNGFVGVVKPRQLHQSHHDIAYHHQYKMHFPSHDEEVKANDSPGLVPSPALSPHPGHISSLECGSNASSVDRHPILFSLEMDH